MIVKYVLLEFLVVFSSEEESLACLAEHFLASESVDGVRWLTQFVELIDVLPNFNAKKVIFFMEEKPNDISLQSHGLAALTALVPRPNS